jgi:hypothetical protein
VKSPVFFHPLENELEPVTQYVTGRVLSWNRGEVVASRSVRKER